MCELNSKCFLALDISMGIFNVLCMLLLSISVFARHKYPKYKKVDIRYSVVVNEIDQIHMYIDHYL